MENLAAGFAFVSFFATLSAPFYKISTATIFAIFLIIFYPKNNIKSFSRRIYQLFCTLRPFSKKRPLQRKSVLRNIFCYLLEDEWAIFF